MRLVWYECSKIFMNRIIWIIFGIFILINLYNLWVTAPIIGKSHPQYDYKQGREAIYRKVEGPITNESIRFVLDGWDATYSEITSSMSELEKLSDRYYTKTANGDWNVYDELKEEMQRQFEYNESIEQIREYAQENLEYLKGSAPSFESRRNQRILEIYGERHIQSFYDLAGFTAYLSYDFSSLLLILLTLLGVVPLFSSEWECGMAPLLSSSRFGQGHTDRNKQIAALIYITFMAVFFFLMDFSHFFFIEKLSGGSNPLYSISEFRYTPFTCTIWQYMLILWGMKLLGLYVIGFIFLLLSSFFRETYPAFILGVGLIIIFMATGNKIAFINPITLLTFNEFSSCLAMVDLFGYPVLAALWLPLFMFVLLLILSLMIFVVNRNRWQFSFNRLWKQAIQSLRWEQKVRRNKVEKVHE